MPGAAGPAAEGTVNLDCYWRFQTCFGAGWFFEIKPYGAAATAYEPTVFLVHVPVGVVKTKAQALALIEHSINTYLATCRLLVHPLCAQPAAMPAAIDVVFAPEDTGVDLQPLPRADMAQLRAITNTGAEQ